MKAFFKNIKVKISVALGIIAGIIGFVMFFVIREKIRTKDKLNYNLERVKYEMEVILLEKDADYKKEKLADLNKEANLIREKIAYIESRESEGNHDVSIEELEDFFNNRRK